MIDGRRLMMASRGGGSGVQIESGQFTVSAKTKTYDIVHSLGAVPNFVFIYPIDVNDTGTTYMIQSQVLVKDCGQSQWRAGTDTGDRSSVHGMYRGVGYALNVLAANPKDALPINNLDINYSGEFTNSYVRVGGYDVTSGSGWLLGTYGYIVGIMPFITPNEQEG